MDIVFNELSIKNLPTSELLAKQAMDHILSKIIKIKKEYKNNVSLTSSESLTNFQICQCDYNINKWISGLEPLKKQIFLTLSTKKPFVHDYPYYYFNRQECKGFAYAHEEDLLSISFDPLKEWTEEVYLLTKDYIDEEEDLAVEEEVLVNHINENLEGGNTFEFIKRKVSENSYFENLGISSGIDLEKSLDELFPNLSFSKVSRECIKKYREGELHVRNIYNQLKELNLFFSTWDGLPVKYSDYLPSKTTTESSSRLTKLEQDLIITCPDAKNRLFDWHQRFTPGAGRIYFYPDNTDSKCYIGYIGNKLVV